MHTVCKDSTHPYERVYERVKHPAVCGRLLVKTGHRSIGQTEYETIIRQHVLNKDSAMELGGVINKKLYLDLVLANRGTGSSGSSGPRGA